MLAIVRVYLPFHNEVYHISLPGFMTALLSVLFRQDTLWVLKLSSAFLDAEFKKSCLSGSTQGGYYLPIAPGTPEVLIDSLYDFVYLKSILLMGDRSVEGQRTLTP